MEGVTATMPLDPSSATMSGSPTSALTSWKVSELPPKLPLPPPKPTRISSRGSSVGTAEESCTHSLTAAVEEEDGLTPLVRQIRHSAPLSTGTAPSGGGVVHHHEPHPRTSSTATQQQQQQQRLEDYRAPALNRRQTTAQLHQLRLDRMNDQAIVITEHEPDDDTEDALTARMERSLTKFWRDERHRFSVGAAGSLELSHLVLVGPNGTPLNTYAGHQIYTSPATLSN